MLTGRPQTHNIVRLGLGLCQTEGGMLVTLSTYPDDFFDQTYIVVGKQAQAVVFRKSL